MLYHLSKAALIHERTILESTYDCSTFCRNLDACYKAKYMCWKCICKKMERKLPFTTFIELLHFLELLNCRVSVFDHKNQHCPKAGYIDKWPVVWKQVQCLLYGGFQHHQDSVLIEKQIYCVFHTNRQLKDCWILWKGFRPFSIGLFWKNLEIISRISIKKDKKELLKRNKLHR